jgi:hypothetical protein
VLEMGDDNMNNVELIKFSVEEFSRLQTYMQAIEKTSKAYELMKVRYIELKVILQASGVNLNDIDILKE